MLAMQAPNDEDWYYVFQAHAEVHKIEVGNGRSLILAARLGNCLSL